MVDTEYQGIRTYNNNLQLTANSHLHSNTCKLNKMSPDDEEENIHQSHRKLDLVRKLESFPLSSFIHLYTSELTQITIKTLDVAGKLKADLDRISVIMKPPDKRMKNNELYKFIEEDCDQKRITCSDLLKVLEVTGNNKVLDFIHSKMKNILTIQSQPEFTNSTNFTLSPNEIEKIDNNGEVERILFNVLKPTESFHGRIHFLEKLHETIQCVKKETDMTVLSQVTPATTPNSTPTPAHLINCPGGIGKTETARQYISLYGQHYTNIIWIEAETRFTMENSFTKLALELGLSIENEMNGKSLEMKEIVHNVYKKLCDGQSHPEKQLLIFDNADCKYPASFSPCASPTSFNNININSGSGGDTRLSMSSQNQGALSIHSFLPSSSLPKTMKRPRVLITSRNKVWNSNLGKILIMELNTLTKDEGADLILNQLGMDPNPPTNHRGATNLACLLGGHPLALKLATSYLKVEQENTSYNSLCLTYSIYDFIQKCKKTASSLNLNPNPSERNSPPQSSPSSSSTTTSSSFDPVPNSIQITWSIIMEKLETVPYGIMAIQMNEFLTFLYADNIPRDFLLSLLPKSEAHAVKKSIKLLKKYGIIDIIKTNSNIKSKSMSNSNSMSNRNSVDSSGSESRGSTKYVKIHRLLQYMTLQSMKVSSENLKIQEKLKVLTNEFRVVLQNVRQLGIHDPIFLSINQLCLDDPFNLIQETSKFLHFNLKYSRFLRQVERYEESLELMKMIEFKRRDILGENHPDTFEAQMDIALILFYQQKYDEALIMYEGIEWAQRVHLGYQDPQTMSTAYNIALVLRKQKNYARALEEIEQVVEWRKRELGPLHMETIKAEKEMAYIFYVSGDFILALKNYETLYVKQCQVYGEIHINSITSKFFQAMCLLKQRKFPEALVVFQELHKLFVINFGENHPESLNIEMHVGMTLEQQGELKESRKVLRKVYQQQKILRGESHEETVNARDWLLYLDEKLHNQMKMGYMQKL